MLDAIEAVGSKGGPTTQDVVIVDCGEVQAEVNDDEDDGVVPLDMVVGGMAGASAMHAFAHGGGYVDNGESGYDDGGGDDY